jgi:asparagine synthase (glutamine-hydrolysing)
VAVFALAVDWRGVPHAAFGGAIAQLERRAIARGQWFDAAGLKLWWAPTADDGASGLAHGRERGNTEFALVDGALEIERAPNETRAQAVLRRYRERGTRSLTALGGDYALIVFDAARRLLLMQRAASGSRRIAWRRDGPALVAASEARAAALLAGVVPAPDPAATAAFFALDLPAAGSSFIEAIAELRAGAQRRIEAEAEREDTMPLALEAVEVDAGDADAVCALWRSALVRSLLHAVGNHERVALWLSGGLDSGALASLLGKRAHALSWSLPVLPECDERAWIETTAAAAGSALTLDDGSDATPLAAQYDWPLDPETPVVSPYALLQQRLHRRAGALGLTRALSGHFGDHVLPDPAWNLVDWARTRRWQRFAAEFASRALRSGWRDRAIRQLARQWFARGASPPSVPWLSPEAQDLRRKRSAEVVPWIIACSRPDTAAALYDDAACWEAALGVAEAERDGIAVRYPWRDPILLAAALAIPAGWHGRETQAKLLTRRMLAGALPDRVRLRPKSASLTPFFRLGVRERARARIEQVLFDPGARWPRFVERGALERAWWGPADPEREELLIWRALSFELWVAKLDSGLRARISA